MVSIHSLELSEEQKLALSQMMTPRSVAELSAKAGVSYVTMSNWVRVWRAQNWVTKTVSTGRQDRYVINKLMIEV